MVSPGILVLKRNKGTRGLGLPNSSVQVLVCDILVLLVHEEEVQPETGEVSFGVTEVVVAGSKTEVMVVSDLVIVVSLHVENGEEELVMSTVKLSEYVVEVPVPKARDSDSVQVVLRG